MSTSSLPASSKPTSVESLDVLLALSLDRLPGVDIAQMNLLCAEGLPGAAGLNVDKCLATLDGWANWVGHETDRHLYRFRCAPADYGHCEGYFRMLMLVTVLQQDFRVRYNPDRVGGIDFRDSRDLFIHGLLEEPHTGTCASMPVLYAAAGRRLGYPLRLVLTHGHVFVRWDSPDGRERFNIECASRGMLSFPDEYYKTWPTPLTEAQVRKGRYLRSLDPAEELAVFVASRGHCLLDNGQTRAARIAYEQACRLEPLSPGHWCWLQEAVHRESRELPPTAACPWHSASECPGVHPPWPGLVDCSAVEPARGPSLNATRYRNFHPTLGRWIERDPAGYVDGVNLYGYVSGNPAGLTDPSGLCGETAPMPGNILLLFWGDPADVPMLRLPFWGDPADVPKALLPFWGDPAKPEAGASITSAEPAAAAMDAAVPRAKDRLGQLERCNASSSSWSSFLDAVLKIFEFIAMIPLAPFTLPGCQSCQDAKDAARAARTTEKNSVNLQKDKRYSDAMEALWALKRMRALPNGLAAAPDEIARLMREGKILGSKEQGSAITPPGGAPSIISMSEEWNAGDIALQLIAEWQRQPPPWTTHGYNTGIDRDKMNKELDAAKKALENYADSMGKDGDKWRPHGSRRHPG